MLANARNHLLITTGNRSEADAGYCTMDGDTAGSIAPLAGVSKHFIRQWLIWARENLNLPVLDLIIRQAPTAELRPGVQTDEGDLMPYDLLEQIELLFLAEKIPPEEILSRLTEIRTESRDYLSANIEKFLRLWKRSQWKRERMAPSFHLDQFNVIPRSMGRYPIFCG
jgi:NAD+ synthase (glutamine-hydrolysing)